MKLASLYAREIDRRIDPVATVSELEGGYIQREIEEYYFTDTLIQHLNALLQKLTSGTSGRTGVWINGYYGSGKSHFLKYIYYCLSPDHRKKAIGHFRNRVYEDDTLLDLEVTPYAVDRVQKNLEQMEVDTIMFNIKNVAGQEEDRQTVTRTFLNRLNHFRGYNKANRAIARFEKHLDGRGLLDEFKEAYQNQTGDSWEEKANDAIDYMLEDVLDVAEAVDPELDRDSTRRAFEQPGDFTTEQFVDELERFLQTKPDTYRLVYLVDEVSQYMEGKVDLLLDLQTIVEEVGSRLGDKVWIICTAQQDLSELVDGVKKKQDATYNFGKIMGRFQDNFLPLESQEADTITKKRVLEKNSTGRAELHAFFEQHEMPLTHQFEPENDLYNGYRGADDFIESYPFVPYQFKLILDVIQSFVSAEFLVAGVSGTERSLLGVTHLTAKNCMDEEVGYVVPFDEFYNNQISSNLTNRARTIVSKALLLEKVKADAFYQRVVKVLFLLSNVTEDRQVTFPATTENLTLLMFNQVDQDRVTLEQRVQEVLDYLLEQNVISVRDGAYRFLQEEEVRVRTEISNFALIEDDRMRIFEEQLVAKSLGWTASCKFKGSLIRLSLKVDELNAGGNGDLEVRLLVYDERSPEKLAMDTNKSTLVLCLHEVFDAQRRKEFYNAAQIQSFVKAHSSRATGKRREAIDTFKREAERTFDDLRAWFADALPKINYISGHQVKEVPSNNGSDPKSVYNRVLEDHLQRVYKKREMATEYAGSKDAVVQAAAREQMEMDESLTPAETEVDSHLKLTPRPVLRDVLTTFSRPPYGWKDTEVIHILLTLQARNRWRFKWNSEDVGRKQFAKQAMNSRERSSLTLHQQEPVDTAVMEQVVRAVNDMFNEQLLSFTNDPRTLAQQLRSVLDTKVKNLRAVVRRSDGYPFRNRIEDFANALEELQRRQQPKALFEAVVQDVEDLQERSDHARSIANFLEQQGGLYDEMRQFVRNQRYNLRYLTDPHDRYASELVQYVEEEEAPHRRLPTMKGYFDAIREALDERQQQAQQEARSLYEAAFDELEERQRELGVDENTLPDRSEWLARIDEAATLSELDNKKRGVEEFKSRFLVQLRNSAAEAKGSGKQTVSFPLLQEVSTRELESEEDVNAFVNDLRSKLLARINDDAIVIIS